jgi:outer membrane lipoprotein-sorting protein
VIRPLGRCLAAAALLATLGAVPENASESRLPPDARSVLTRMAQRNSTLSSYQARLHVDIRMLSFPFLSPKLDGTSYYRRPDTYVVVFDRMPSYARGFSRMFNDVGNPLAWEKEQNVSVEGSSTIDGRAMIVLRLTKKIHSDILDHTLAYVDAASYTLTRMEWYYTNGGKIAMTQQYRVEGGYVLLAAQHGTINIPYVRAVADAAYGTYQTNVNIPSTATASP